MAAYRLAIEQGADAIEPDLVVSRDGVLVIRHESEISRTTDVAEHPEFADRRTSQTIDGAEHTGWFTEDFDWAELQSLRVIERVPRLRPDNAAFNGQEPLLRLEDLLGVVAAASRPVTLVIELKQATYFASRGFALAALFADSLARAGITPADRLIIESFELTVLSEVRRLGVPARLVYLVEASGSPVDRPGHPYSESITDQGLRELADVVDGISVDKALLWEPDASGSPHPITLAERAHACGLELYTWTLRAENAFLHPAHRGAGGPGEFGDWQREFALLLSSGVDGVFADQPDLALEVRGAVFGR